MEQEDQSEHKSNQGAISSDKNLGNMTSEKNVSSIQNDDSTEMGDVPLHSPYKAGPSSEYFIKEDESNLDAETIEKLNGIIFNMSLAHEMSLDSKFTFRSEDSAKNSVWDVVKDIVHRAFWDIVSEQLSQTPPVLTAALKIILDIKEGLRSVLLPYQTRLKLEIDNLLDMDLIKQQIEHDAFDFRDYTTSIINFMAKVCAPVRDADIKALLEIQDLVPLLKGILETIKKMELDLLNFTLTTIKRDISNVKYEQDKFEEYLKVKGSDELPIMKQWLSNHHTQEMNPNDAEAIIYSAFLDFMTWEWTSKSFPETLILDVFRYKKLQTDYYRLTLTATIVLVALSSFNSSLSADNEFKIKLSEHISVLLNDLSYNSIPPSKLTSVVEQVVADASSRIEERGLPSLDPNTVQIITDQIMEVSDPNHRVRVLVDKRLREFLCDNVSSHPSLFKVPPALNIVRSELLEFATEYQKITLHNIKVFGSYYRTALFNN